ncbi:MAG: hypothetical protein QXN96_05935 [Candidatus Bathyarchaeia archaeon]
MSGSVEEGDLKAGFYYDLKFVMLLLYVVFIIVFVAWGGLSAFTDFAMFNLIFICIITYLDLQEFIEVKVPRHGWKNLKSNYKIASAFLIISLFFVSMGEYFFDSKLAARSPFFFVLSLGLMLTPILGIIFALTCYLDYEGTKRLWEKDNEIAGALLNHSYFYRKIFGRKLAQKS